MKTSATTRRSRNQQVGPNPSIDGFGPGASAARPYYSEGGFPNHLYNELRSFANITKMYDEIVIVTENRPLSGSHFLLSVESPRQAQATRPGQFAMLRILGRSGVVAPADEHL